MLDLIKVYVVEDAAIARASLESMLEDNNMEVVGSSAKAEKAWDDIQKLKVDLILLDINLAGDKNGIWLAKQIRNKFSIPIIYLTAYGDQKTLDEVIATKPNGYLMKPYQEATLIATINIALENFIYSTENTNFVESKNKINEYLFVKKNKKVVKIQLASILYIQVEEKYCNLRSADDAYLVRMSLKKIMELLPDKNFKQVHRNCIVNIDKIKEIYFEDSLIVLENNDKIPFSEHYKSLFKKDNDIFY